MKHKRYKVAGVSVAATHVVQEFKDGYWNTIHEASEACCIDAREKANRWFPDKQHRIVTADQVASELRRKGWSVHDADHVPVGSHIMLAASPERLHPELKRVREVFGMRADGDVERTGTVRHRDPRSSWYMVQMDRSKLVVGVDRADLIYPVPDNLVAFEPNRRRTQR